MKVVVCTGTPWTDLEQVGTVLKAAGMQSPINPVRGQATIESFHAQLEKVGQADSRSFIDQPIPPGKIWGQQALGILQDNLNQQVWGWTNSFSTWLLEFWKSLDQNIFFVLVYSTPEEDIARFMRNEEEASSRHGADFWLACNTQLLRFYNRNSKRSILVDRNKVLSDPSVLLDFCNERFGLTLQVDIAQPSPESQPPDAIGIVLAQSLLQGRDDVYSLYHEMQATATHPAEDDYTAVVDTAWSSYRDLLNTLTAQQEQYIRKLADQSRELEGKNAELEQCKSENELFLLQLHQVQEELETTFLNSQKQQAATKDRLAEQERQLQEKQSQVEQLKKSVGQLQGEFKAVNVDSQKKQIKTEGRLVEQKRQLQEKQKQVEKLKKDVSQLKGKLNTVVRENQQDAASLKKVEGKREELEKENELLLLQLHQVQEELEHYFLLYQESQAKQEEQVAQAQSDGRVKLFMSELPPGNNWYPVEEVEEEKLRWSGPGTRATIKLPIKRDTEKLLVIHYEQVVALDQLKGLRVEVDAEPVAHTVYDTLSQKYIVVQLPATPEPHSLETELAIVLSKMVKPSDVVGESPDDRPLGIAVYSLSVLPVTPRLRINWPDSSYRRLQLKRKISRIGGGIETFPLAYFDGKAYLQEYPDVADAVRQGTVASALVHYVQHGAYDGHAFMLADAALPSEGDAHDLARIEQP